MAPIPNPPPDEVTPPDRSAVAAALRDIEAGAAPAEAAAALGIPLLTFEEMRERALAQRRPKLVCRLPLMFRDINPNAKSAIHEDISAIAAIGDGESLWIGADEGVALERLTAQRDESGRIVGYGEHVRFDLHDFFDFPNGREEEADVEGLSVADGYLWVVGSHSLKRKKPNPLEDTLEEALAKLTRVEREANRFLLGRIPLVAGDTPGVPTLARSAPPVDGSDRKRKAAVVKMTHHGSALGDLLRHDKHLAPFLSVPSKDNGLDIEGMAVREDRVFLGLRGPVLRGWALILEAGLEAAGKGRLKLKALESDDTVTKHFLDLDGLGVRSLLIYGADLLVLAGPTMDLDGPVRLYRWRDALSAPQSSVVPRSKVERVLDLPFGEGDDHAEGATLLPLSPGGPLHLVVAYDTPARARWLPNEAGVEADVFDLEGVL